MQSLPSPRIAPSSQEAGNLMQPTLSDLTGTAPGSQPVTPLPPPEQGSHVPEPQPDINVPVNTTRGRWSTGEPGTDLSWRPFGDAGVPDETGPWRQL